MGIVIRQSFWTTVFSYLGVAIAYINQLWLFPYFFSTEQVGLFRQIQSAALLIVPLSILGMSATANRYLPLYKNKERYGDFVTVILILTTIGAIISGAILVLFKESIQTFFEDKSPMVNEYYPVFLGLVIVITFVALWEGISRANLEVVIPSLAKEVFLRVAMSVVVVLFGIGLISIDQSVYSLLVNYALVLLIILFSSYKKGFIKLRFRKVHFVPITKEVSNYALFALLGAASSAIVVNIDIQMISSLMGLAATGIYSIAFYMAVVIELPRRSLLGISEPIISKAIHDKDMDLVSSMNQRISLNLTIAGAFLFLLISVNLTEIFAMIPKTKDYELGYYVVLIIGAAKMLDMLFGANGQIIVMSQYYRFNIITVLLLAAFTVLLNLLLIPKFGLEGAAIASLLSILIFNIIKSWFVWWKFKLPPFNMKSLLVLAIAGAVYLVVSIIPLDLPSVLSILIKSTMILILFGLPIYGFSISPELNQLITDILRKLRRQT